MNPIKLFALICTVALVPVAGPVYAQIQARVCVTTKQVEETFGTNKVKAIFKNGNDTYLADFSQEPPSLQKVAALTGANLPVISPDGKWVTYQTGTPNEGPCVSNCNSVIWLKSLTNDSDPLKIAENGYVPRFIESASPDTPTVIYSTSVSCPSCTVSLWNESYKGYMCTMNGSVVRRKIPGGTEVLSPETVHAGGSFYGGISYDDRYLSTGWPAGPNVFMLDILHPENGVQPIHVLKARVKATQQDTLVVIGACNMSRSPSRYFTNTILYYDFGFISSQCTHPYWKNWSQHQLLFIARMTDEGYGEQLRVFDLPLDQPVVSASATALSKAVSIEWANPEWTNHPYFATASLVVDRLWKPGSTYAHTYNREGLYAIDLFNETCLRLITTTDTSLTSATSFSYPYIWIEIPANFQESTTWLSEVDSRREMLKSTAVISAYRPGKESRAHDLRDKGAGNTLVYTVSGRFVGALNGNNTSSRTTFAKLGRGAYIVKIAHNKNEFSEIPWIVQ